MINLKDEKRISSATIDLLQQAKFHISILLFATGIMLNILLNLNKDLNIMDVTIFSKRSL